MGQDTSKTGEPEPQSPTPPLGSGPQSNSSRSGFLQCVGGKADLEVEEIGARPGYANNFANRNDSRGSDFGPSSNNRFDNRFDNHQLERIHEHAQHGGGPMRGPISETGSISGFSKSSRGSRRLDDDDEASLSNMRMKAEQEWMDKEANIMQQLRRFQGFAGVAAQSESGHSDASHNHHKGHHNRHHHHAIRDRDGDWDSRSDSQSDRSGSRSQRSYSSRRSSGRGSDAGRPRHSQHHAEYGHSQAHHDHHHHHRGDDRSNGSGSGRGSRGSHGGRNIGEHAMEIYPAHGYAAASSLGTRDLEAKLRSAQRKVEEVEQEKHEQEQRAKQMEKKLEANNMRTGGDVMKYQLMQEIVNIRDRVLELDKIKSEEEKKLSGLEDNLRQEEERREEAEKKVKELEADRNDLTAAVEKWKLQATLADEEKTKRNAETHKLQRELDMVSIERDETLELLERAVNQKEELKRGKQNENQKQTQDLERMRQDQEHEQTEVRRLLTNVDQLLARFSKNERRSDARDQESIAATNDLIGIRDSVRRLVKARDPNDAKH